MEIGTHCSRVTGSGGDCDNLKCPFWSKAAAAAQRQPTVAIREWRPRAVSTFDVSR